MKKIILLEDKIDRDSLKQSNVDFKLYDNFVAVFGRDNCNKYLSDFDKLDDFDTIMIHASIQIDEHENIIQQLKNYCNDKSLVIFSGGGDIGTFKNNMLEVTAKSLYANLPIFLEKYPKDSHILMLAYGENWSLNIFLGTLEKLNILIEDSNENFEEDFDEFEDDFFYQVKKVLNDEDYKSIFDKVVIDDYEINLSQIKTIRDNLSKIVNRIIHE